ncbi:hypothetical protein [Actinokineospora terrae]|uniref:Uncharacterized protein n=1 Tax=Actinokineospora terrae TaxID=155974 RepID=A0A1H9X3L6_9PSEU|nr:hypothetical protein [Actinokineospora terrae]SES40798.1 hypothetical protein SAMN04487818_112246 [Actinokineospora terrae]
MNTTFATATAATATNDIARIGMTEDDVMATLFDVSEGAVLFQVGDSDSLTGFRWAYLDGTPAGTLPLWQSDVLAALLRRGLIAIEPASTQIRRVTLTGKGAHLFAGITDLAIAA